MINKLKLKAIYEDFLNNVELTEEQKIILDMYIKRESIIKISMKIGVSERTIGYEIKKIKKLYNDYYNLQLTRAALLME